MKTPTVWQCFSLLIMAALATPAGAAPVPIDTSNTQNGIFDIYSATFDPPLNPVGDPFFGGTPPASRALLISPNPTGVANIVPGGFAAPPASGSFLDISLGAGNTQVTLSGGTIATPVLGIIINQGQATETNIIATGAGFVFSAAPVTVPVDANGIAVFEVSLAPGLAVDFSTLSTVVTSCTGAGGVGVGPLCALVSILTLDMVRYRLTLDFDPTFESFTGDLIGQTANNSMVFGSLESGVPNIRVTDNTPPTNDQLLAFGQVTESTSITRVVTVTNTGSVDLVLGPVASANGVAAPFAIVTDGCSGQSLAPAATCNISISFSPVAIAPFVDSFDIPSSDPDQPTVTVNLSGSGVATPVPDISVTDSVSPASDGIVPFGNVVVGATSATQTITVTNLGNADLVLGLVGVAGSGSPFSRTADTCSSQTLPPDATCALGLQFAPAGPGFFQTAVSIPSNDPDQATVTITAEGTGATATLSPEGADSGFMGLDLLTLVTLGGGIGLARRRRSRAPALS